MPSDRYSQLKAGAANPRVVFDLLEDLRGQFEKIVSEYHGDVTISDIFMLSHNLHKLVVQNLVAGR